jgi:translation initiation factor IF-3
MNQQSKLLVNNQIKTQFVKVVNIDELKNREINVTEALRIADQKNLDLVEFNPGICKMIDYEKHIYTQSKNETKPIKTKLKEIQLSQNIAENDLTRKINDGKKFLSEKNHIKEEKNNICLLAMK